MRDHGGKQREEKLKTKTNRRRKRNKEIRNKSNMYYIRAGKNFNNYTPQLFQNMIDRSYITCQPIYFKIFRMLNFINKDDESSSDGSSSSQSK